VPPQPSTIKPSAPNWFHTLPTEKQNKLHKTFSYFSEPSQNLKDLLCLEPYLTNEQITQLFLWKFPPKIPKTTTPDSIKPPTTKHLIELFPPTFTPIQQIPQERHKHNHKKRKQQEPPQSLQNASKQRKHNIQQTNNMELPEKLAHIHVQRKKQIFKQVMTTIGNKVDNISSKNVELGGNLVNIIYGIGKTILPTIGNHASPHQKNTTTR
jgi:hypothetical protein